MEWWKAVLPVITLVIGYLGTLVTEAEQGRLARRIAKEGREDALSAKHTAERRAFELETLTDLKAALADLGRAAGRAHHFDLMTARENGSPTLPSTQLPEDMSTALFDANGRVQSLVGLVMDEGARSKVSEFASAVARLGVTSRPEAQAEREFLTAVELLEEAQRLLAGRIRSIYEGTADKS